MRYVWPSLAALLMCTPAAAGVGAQVIDGFVTPATARFTQTSAALAASVATLCRQPAEAALASSRADFAAALADWGRVSVLRFGPLAAEGRFERLYFWPDARGIGQKQIQGLLAKADEASLSGDMSAKSAALQGFPALEFTLYGTGADRLAAGDAWRCAVAAAIASNIADIAGAVAAEWRPETAFARSFAGPAGTAEPYRTEAEVQGEIVKALSTGLQFVRSAELAPALGDEAAKANGKRAPFWRSGLTASFVSAQVEGVRQMLAAAGYEQSLPEDSRYVASSIRFELDSTIRTLARVDGPADKAFDTEPNRGRFAFAALSLHHANELVNDALSGALGLTMGFNALDGD